MQDAIKNFMKYRFLLIELVKKGIKLKYRRSYMGILWSMIEPLLTMVVLAYVFGRLLGNTDPYFPLYILSGRLLFSLFQSSTKEALKSVRSNASMIKKVYVPKYMYPFSSVFFNYTLFLISLVVLAIVMIYYRRWPTWHIFEAIVPMIILLIMSLGVGLILATMNVFFHDIEYLWNVGLMLVMYCSAIFYKPEALLVSSAGWVLRYNPLYAVIDNFRRTVIYGQGLAWKSTLYAFAVAVVSLIIGLYVFYKKQDEFILHI